MSVRKKGPPLGEWRYQVGEPPCQLTAYERRDRGMAIYTRAWDGSSYSVPKKLRESIRTPRGAIDQEAELDAQSLTLERHRILAAGLAALPEESRAPLTLARGIAKRLHPKEGEWATETPHVRSVRKSLRQAAEIIGADLLWSDLRHAHYRKLWRELARRYVNDGEGGPRWTEMVCGNLQSTARWLQQEGLVEPGDGQPAARWNQTMRKEWREIVGRPVPAPRKLRYTPTESAKLWRTLPAADPRLYLAMEIGAEMRLGQVIRAMRSDVLASPDRSEPLHAVRIHGAGRKEGGTVVLTPESREALRTVLQDGYLSLMESAYQAGEIKDYPLFPGHKIRGGKMPAGRTRQLSRTGLHQMWRDLEDLAEVPHVDHRAWYGIRRLQSDQAEDVESDARVLNVMGGWKHTGTRERYQEEGRLDIAEKAAESRRKIRPATNPETL